MSELVSSFGGFLFCCECTADSGFSFLNVPLVVTVNMFSY
jgi:hypothetical protein